MLYICVKMLKVTDWELTGVEQGGEEGSGYDPQVSVS